MRRNLAIFVFAFLLVLLVNFVMAAGSPVTIPSLQDASPAPEPIETPADENTQNGATTESRSLSDMLTGLLNTIMGLLVVVLLGYLIYKLFVEAANHRFELADVINGTGDKSLDDSLTGLQVFIRETLIKHLDTLRQNTVQYSGRLAAGAQFPEKTPLPDDVQTTAALDNVIASLGEESPKYIKPLISLIRYFSPQKGIQVRTTLQHDGNTPGKLGVSFEILDFRKQEKPIVFTLWEAETKEKKLMPWVLTKPAQSTSPAPNQNVDINQVATTNSRTSIWSTVAAEALQRAYQYQDAINYYQMSLLKDNNDETAAREMVLCQQKLGLRSGFETAFATAAKLEESGLVDVTIESYARVFPEKEDIDAARRYWKIALAKENNARGDAYFQLAKIYFDRLGLHKEAVALYKLAIQEGSTSAMEALKQHYEQQAKELVAASQLLYENQQWKSASQYLSQVLDALPDHAGARNLLAKVKQNQPVEEDKEALASYELGKIYQARRDFSAAAEKFKTAIEKKPDYAEAKEGLIEVLNGTSSTRSKFENFLRRALVRLAIEIYRAETNETLARELMKTTTDVKLNREEKRAITELQAIQDRRRAQYHNFYGAHLLSRSGSFPAHMTQAKTEFSKASKFCPDWLQPYDHLGDVFAIEALDIQESDEAFRYLERSISYYEIALKKKEMDKSGNLSTAAALSRVVELQIKLDRHYADLLRWAQPLEDHWNDIRVAEVEVRSRMTDGVITLEPDLEEIYYGLASWYSLIAYRSGEPEAVEAKRWSCFYLSCSGFINFDRTTDSASDLLLSKVFPDDTKRENLFTLIKTKKIQQEALQPAGKFTWKDVRDTLKKAEIELPAQLSNE